MIKKTQSSASKSPAAPDAKSKGMFGSKAAEAPSEDEQVSLNFEVDGFELRPHGVSQADIHPAIATLMGPPGITFSMASSDAFSEMLTEILQKRPDQKLAMTVASVTEGYFGGHEFKAGGIQAKSSLLLMSDHEDTEAIAVSRLFQSVISAKLAQLKGGAGAGDSTGLTSAQAGMQSYDDVDLRPDEFNTLLQANGIAILLVVITTHTMKSVPQLARMGLIYQYNPDMQPIPIVIGNTFNFPSDALLMKIEEGKVLALGSNPSATLEAFTGEPVTLQAIRMAMQATLGFFIAFIDVAALNQAQMRTAVNSVLTRAAGMMAGAAYKAPLDKPAIAPPPPPAPAPAPAPAAAPSDAKPETTTAEPGLAADFECDISEDGTKAAVPSTTNAFASMKESYS